jgi:hypothetical protein
MRWEAFLRLPVPHIVKPSVLPPSIDSIRDILARLPVQIAVNKVIRSVRDCPEHRQYKGSLWSRERRAEAINECLGGD